MEIEENNEPVLRESTSKANQTRKGLPQTKVSKTGKVQELVTPKGPKSTDPIRGMQSRSRFDISRILDLPLELTVGELLDRSDITIKDLAFNMQRSTPRYRIKRSKVNAEGDTQEAENVQASMTISAAVLPPEVTARAYEDDGLSKPLMINSWIGTQRLPKSLLDGGSLVELLNRKVYNKMKPKPRIWTDGYIRVSLANDSVTTLREYVLVPVNVEGIEAVIKAWLVDVEVYDLLLGVSWLRRVHCNQKYGQGKITVMGDDMTVREVPAQLMPVSTNLPVVEWLSMKEVGGRSVAHIGHGRLMGQCGAWRSNSLNWTHSALVILGGRPGVAYRLAYSVLETRASLWREVLSQLSNCWAIIFVSSRASESSFAISSILSAFSAKQTDTPLVAYLLLLLLL